MFTAHNTKSSYKASTDWVIIGSDNDYHLFGTKPLPEPMMTVWKLDPSKQTWNTTQTFSLTVGHTFEKVVYKMLAILFRPQIS